MINILMGGTVDIGRIILIQGILCLLKADGLKKITGTTVREQLRGERKEDSGRMVNGYLQMLRI